MGPCLKVCIFLACEDQMSSVKFFEVVCLAVWESFDTGNIVS